MFISLVAKFVSTRISNCFDLYVLEPITTIDQLRQSVDHTRLIVTVDPVSHREPRIVWSITSLSWTTRLSLCHDPAGHPRRDANMGVKFAIGRDIFGFWYIVSSIRIRERVRRNWWRGKVAREVVELLRGEFWSFIEEFGISKRGYWERTRSLRES